MCVLPGLLSYQRAVSKNHDSVLRVLIPSLPPSSAVFWPLCLLRSPCWSVNPVTRLEEGGVFEQQLGCEGGAFVNKTSSSLKGPGDCLASSGIQWNLEVVLRNSSTYTCHEKWISVAYHLQCGKYQQSQGWACAWVTCGPGYSCLFQCPHTFVIRCSTLKGPELQETE